ncbi:MAG: hypothetical protein PHE55_09985 [Methylococcaceae bacterium]|nr:hypothetical protein [Methylococcaceae bacterium]
MKSTDLTEALLVQYEALLRHPNIGPSRVDLLDLVEYLEACLTDDPQSNAYYQNIKCATSISESIVGCWRTRTGKLWDQIEYLEDMIWALYNRFLARREYEVRRQHAEQAFQGYPVESPSSLPPINYEAAELMTQINRVDRAPRPNCLRHALVTQLLRYLPVLHPVATHMKMIRHAQPNSLSGQAKLYCGLYQIGRQRSAENNRFPRFGEEPKFQVISQ